MLIDPTALTPQEVYKLLIGGITPRPIAWVSTQSSAGITNLAPFSFFTVASANPPVLCINPLTNAKGNEKDTLVNIREQGQFVVNTVSARHLEKMNETCKPLASDIDEFDIAGVAKSPSAIVVPPRVTDAVVSYECELIDIVDLGDEALAGHLVLGRVVAIHIDDEAEDDFRIDSGKLDTIGRMAGDDYCLTRERINLTRER